ncbi:hypothetical protein [Oceanicella actignis]|uniref:Tellurite resistance protein n=1 Tax=Oceanicella actignis TaxID=1189325 RepID=A0A1M7U3R7_9RHOB|nr:hypothetical protein [Oceanicella actignis]SET87283.1 tellurite resistance protein [Oceanicella actignis]SHN77554.1 tellurite resistance protein [Oceanicella actignis]
MPAFAAARRRSFPPVLFPTLLGLVGTGLTLRAGARVLGLAPWIGELWLGVASMALLLAGALYLAALARRPARALEDLSPPPARGALAALSMGLMLVGAAAAPALPGAAAALWVGGAALHWVFAGATLHVLLSAPPHLRPVTPALYLPFVGQIVAPIGGAALGFGTASAVLYGSALAVWAALTPLMLAWLRGALAGGGLAPTLRPGLAIFVAPPALAAIGGAALGAPWSEALVLPAWAVALAAALALAPRLGWLAEGGWSPAWGAFTFPLAGLAGATMLAAERLPGAIGGAAGAAAGQGAWWLAALLTAAACATTLRVAAGAALALRDGRLKG